MRINPLWKYQNYLIWFHISLIHQFWYIGDPYSTSSQHIFNRYVNTYCTFLVCVCQLPVQSCCLSAAQSIAGSLIIYPSVYQFLSIVVSKLDTALFLLKHSLLHRPEPQLHETINKWSTNEAGHFAEVVVVVR